MFRTRVKTIGCGVLQRSGAERCAGLLRRNGRWPVVLCYHRVVEDFPSASTSFIPAMLISRKMLEHHLDALGRSYQFISVDQVAETAERGQHFQRPAAVISFDDGYADVYFNAFPILKRKGIPAVVFPITELVGTAQVPLHDQIYFQLLQWFASRTGARLRLKEILERSGIRPEMALRLSSRTANPYKAARGLLTDLPQKDLLRVVRWLSEESPRPGAHLPQGPEHRMMSWEMLSEMQRSGSITVGSHTATHPMLTKETLPEISGQLQASRHQLETALQVPVRHVAYPDGRFDAETLEVAAATGYRYGYTTCSHRAPGACASLAIPRKVLWEKSWADSRGVFSPAIMNCHLLGFFDWAARCRQDHGLTRNGRTVPEISAAEIRDNPADSERRFPENGARVGADRIASAAAERNEQINASIVGVGRGVNA